VSGYGPGPFDPGARRAAPRRRSPVHRLVAAVLVTGLALVVGLQLLARFGPEPGAAGPAGTASRTASPPVGAGSASTPPSAAAPSATPQQSRPKRSPNRSLTRNSLYAVDLDGTRVRCGIRVRAPKPPLRNGDLAPYLRGVVRCLVKVYRGPLAAQGFTLTTPKIRVYKATVASPCGRFGQRGAPAYYCSADQTIYWPATRDEGREAYTFARLGYVALLAHEFGHHLQAVTGMIGEYSRRYTTAKAKRDRYLISRRLELQAQCFEGIYLTTVARSIRLSPADRDELRRWHSFTGDEDPPDGRRPDHGTSAAQFRWLERGLDSQDFGRCNTWTAPRSAVK
jgi:hypothetical protein